MAFAVRSSRMLPVVMVVLCATAFRSPTFAQECVGDCSTDGVVTVNELITGVNIALGNQSIGECVVFDADGDGAVTVNELVVAVNNALSGCTAPHVDRGSRIVGSLQDQ